MNINQNFNAAIIRRDIDSLKPWARNARTHSKRQIKQIARSIEEFGFTVPVLIDENDNVLAGHGRLEAGSFSDKIFTTSLADFDLDRWFRFQRGR